MNDLASDACYTDETYVVVSKMIDEASKLVATMRRTQSGPQQEEGENVPPQPYPPPQHDVNQQQQ